MSHLIVCVVCVLVRVWLSDERTTPTFLVRLNPGKRIYRDFVHCYDERLYMVPTTRRVHRRSVLSVSEVFRAILR